MKTKIQGTLKVAKNALHSAQMRLPGVIHARHRGGGGSRRGSRNIGKEEAALVARVGVVHPENEAE